MRIRWNSSPKKFHRSLIRKASQVTCTSLLKDLILMASIRSLVTANYHMPEINYSLVTHSACYARKVNSYLAWLLTGDYTHNQSTVNNATVA